MAGPFTDDRIFVSELVSREELREIVSQAGVGVELIRFSVSDNLDNLDQNIIQAKKDLEYWGNPSVIFHGPFLDLNPMCYDSRVRQVTMDRFNECYQAARVLGAQKIVYHSCMVPTVYYLWGWAERMADFWNEFLTDKHDIPIVMENVLDREYSAFSDVLSGVKDSDFGICLDVGHAHCYSDHEAWEWVDALGSAIRHLHLHDNDGSWDTHLAIGEGTINFDRIFECLSANLASDLTFTVECASAEATLKSISEIQNYLL